MRALFNVNVLLALFDPDHTFNRRARAWWSTNRTNGWATCPLTQNGFVRVMSQPSYRQNRSIADAAALLKAGVLQRGHALWPDDVAMTDVHMFDHSRILGPKQITDIYLLALAVRNEGRLVTFDRGIPLAAVRSAEPRHLIVL